MTPMKSEAEIGAIVDELLDDETAAAWGPEAGFLLAVRLGLMDGDVIVTDEAGHDTVASPATEIEAEIAAARAAKAAGISMARHFG
jgi:hypothetical protein